ncbi:MAG: mucoidy inhibitor MuiA family protein [Proteobacteria bacterium]|nr:mucoidy inhibitor MuiA family protein [Desulfobacteraceae bacterium]MBU3981733.1 mucoidy inhibitor MuiA family protein [Pseudomonadota bacterium]MBU4013414.1 mucoidy inhibitor MuiA family protein [Pseudomonadota bacterium]MBU4067190.1 mucoidy inhibitor MuiA family protein [Pseudomonadota bacterium]MBU4100658.1 mucoidy inhibitor MuiA family protein [Pseudomonadota bacterium]
MKYINKIIFFVLLSLIVCINPQIVWASKIIQSKIDAVTVYPDRAMITRTADIDLVKGSQELLVIDNLPTYIIDDSVRVMGQGSVKAKISGVKIKRIFLQEHQQKKIEELLSELEKLNDENKGLEATLESLNVQKKFIESIKISTSDKISKELYIQKADTKNWDKVLDFIYQKLGRINEQAILFDQEKRGLLKKIKAIEAELNRYRNQRSPEKKLVEIAIEAEAKGKMTLKINYLITGASWIPSYDVRVDLDKSELCLNYFGIIRQRTGEDWNDVKLSLSTAKPHISGLLPELDPWYIDFRQPVFKQAMKRALADTVMQEAYKPSSPQEELKQETAYAESRGTSVTFNIKKRETILGKDEPFKTTITQEELQAKLSYICTPKLYEFAFLKAEIVNDTKYPFIEGEVSIFLGENYIGKSKIDAIPIDKTFDLHLGIDERIHVERRLIGEKADKSFIGKKAVHSYTYRITIENLIKEEKRIIVHDQVPVARHPDIQVKLVRSVPAMVTKEDVQEESPGLLEWELSLPAQKTKTIEFEFSVAFPKSMRVKGL